MNEIPDFISNELMKNIIEINRDVEDIDHIISQKLDYPIHLTDFVGKGGTSVVYKATYKDKIVAIKLCDLDKWSCLAFKDEVKNAYDFLQLNQLKKCYNYPIIYGYFHACLFFEWIELQEIFAYMSTHQEKIGEQKDAFILYCTTPSHIELSDELKTYVANHFDADFIIESVKKLPKSKNSIGLINYLNRYNINWENNKSLYSYLFDLEMNETVCSVFVMQQFLDGKTLDKYHNKLTDMLFFEYIYSKLMSIHILGKILDDVHVDNMMIVDCNVLRMYFYNQKYYPILGNMFYHIDLTSINDRYQSRKVNKSTFNIISEFFTSQQKEWIDVHANGLAADVLSHLFEWIEERGIKGMNEKDAKIYMIKLRNYKIIDANI